MSLSLKTRRRVLLVAALVLPVLAVILYRFPPAENTFYPRCVMYSMTRLHCPGCGGTRCLHALFHGDLLQALAYNALIVLMMPFLAVWLLRHLWAAVRGHDAPPTRLSPRVGMALAGLFIAYGILRNVPVFPLTLLAPHPLRAEQAALSDTDPRSE